MRIILLVIVNAWLLTGFPKAFEDYRMAKQQRKMAIEEKEWDRINIHDVNAKRE
jgi:hypothetical protein